MNDRRDAVRVAMLRSTAAAGQSREFGHPELDRSTLRANLSPAKCQEATGGQRHELAGTTERDCQLTCPINFDDNLPAL
jgi:hypothetical protein